MITIEQALAATPPGFKIKGFTSGVDFVYYEDRNSNVIVVNGNLAYAKYNGEISPSFTTTEEAARWIESKKRWWK